MDPLTLKQEGQEGVIKLDEDADPQVQDDPQTVDALIHYLYTFDYGSDCPNGQDDVAGIVLDVRMYLIASKVKYSSDWYEKSRS